VHLITLKIKTLLNSKTQIDPYTMIVGDFNKSLSPVESHPDKNQQKKSELTDTIDQTDLKDICMWYFIQLPQNTHSSQQLMELSPKRIIF
jgi:hypothetical protein